MHEGGHVSALFRSVAQCLERDVASIKALERELLDDREDRREQGSFEDGGGDNAVEFGLDVPRLRGPSGFHVGGSKAGG